MMARLHRRFREVAKGSYDLAIDLRYDTDTRRLLTMIDAKWRVGVADAGEFPFLDLAVASDRLHAAAIGQEGERRVVDIPFANGAPQRLSAARKDLVLRFEFEEEISARTRGTSSDERQLGLSLKRAQVTRRGFRTAGWYPDDGRIWTGAPEYGGGVLGLDEIVSFTSDAAAAAELELGFSAPEKVGTWTVGLTAQMRLPVEAGVHGDLLLCLQMEGYVPRSRRRSFDLWCNDWHLARTTLDCDGRSGTLIVPISVDALHAAAPTVISDRFAVELGDAIVRVRIEPIGRPDLSGRSALLIEIINDVDRVLACRTLSGEELALAGANDVEFLQDDPRSLVRVRLTLKGQPFAIGLDVRSLQIATVCRRFAPRVHVTDWGGLIADTAIRHFSADDDLIDMPEIALPPALEAEIAADVTAGRKIVIVAIGANKDVTKWPLAYYGRLIELIQQAVPCGIYLVGAAREHTEAQTIARHRQADGHVVNACGATSLVQLPSLLKRADLFIGGSTGTTHAAAMSGVNTLALLSATNHPHQWAPIGARASFLSLDVPCRECHILFMSQCNHGYRCMIELTPELVFERALTLLGGPQSGPSKPSVFPRGAVQ